MAKISLNKRIEATKLNERTGAPLSGPEVTIPFGALVESVGTERDEEKFRFLGQLYSVRRDIFLAASRADDAAPVAPPEPEIEPSGAAAEALASQDAAPAKSGARAAKLKFERLDAGAYAVARAKVPGGWLVACGAGVTFYPDPAHEWDGTSAE